MTRVFVTGGERLDRRRARRRGWSSAATTWSRSPAPTRRRPSSGAGARTVRGDVLDEDALADGMRGCELVYHVAGINTFCPTDPAALFHVNVRGAEIAVRAAHAAGARRIVLTSSAATLGEDARQRRYRGQPASRQLHVGLRAVQARRRDRGVRRGAERWDRARRGHAVVRPGSGARRAGRAGS